MRNKISTLFNKLKNRKYTIIIVEHETDELAKMVDKLLVLDKGEMVAFGNAKGLFTDIPLLKNMVWPRLKLQNFYKEYRRKPPDCIWGMNAVWEGGGLGGGNAKFKKRN